jgi:plasmid replication initiation protein
MYLFNYYNQRKYDYDELEKKLLGWDKEEIDSA